MSSAIINGVTTEFSVPRARMWRSHNVLSESEAESSPEAAQQFRKLRSSTSLNSLRVSLRKRLPLKPVQHNSISESSTSESLEIKKKTSTVTQIKRTAKNSFGSAYQRFQKNMASHEEHLIRTPGQIAEGDENESGAVAMHTPKRKALTPRRTPKSGTKRTQKAAATPEHSNAVVRAVRTGATRRQLVRMAALRSPFASPNTMSQRRQLDEDLDCVATGLRKLKHLSQAFNEVIGRDDRTEAVEHYRTKMVQRFSSSQRCNPGKLNRPFIRQQNRQIRNRVASWTDSALSNFCKTT